MRGKKQRETKKKISAGEKRRVGRKAVKKRGKSSVKQTMVLPQKAAGRPRRGENLG